MAKIYEGIYYQAQVIQSNRTGTQIEFTGMGDAIFNVPAKRTASIQARLEAGTSPDEIAKSLPVD